MNPEMTEKQAMDYIKLMYQAYVGNVQQHGVMQNALKVVEEALAKKPHASGKDSQ